jgi:hypothetical protein
MATEPDLPDPERNTPGEPAERARTHNLPPFTGRDWLGIAVAIIGTIALILLAADCHDPTLKDEEQGRNFLKLAEGCSVRALIAGAFFLINLAHVVGLLLFESVGYRGAFEKFFARLSLYGTPLALIVSALIQPT